MTSEDRRAWMFIGGSWVFLVAVMVGTALDDRFGNDGWSLVAGLIGAVVVAMGGGFALSLWVRR